MKIIKVLRNIVIIAIIMLLIYYYGYYSPNNNIVILNEDISSTLIDEKLNDFKIIVFSDVLYNGDFSNFETAIQLINEENADIVVFAGDLLHPNKINNLSDSEQNELIELLTNINSKYGKFAVLGENDDATNLDLTTLLFNSNFEVIDNKALKISNESSTYFNLIGLENTIDNSYNTDSIYAGISNQHYTITICHTPDILSDITNETNLLIAAHTLGGEQNLPIYGPLKSINGMDKYYNGIHTVNNSTFVISNGIGSFSDYRLFAQMNIVSITLHNKNNSDSN